jgi:hypothetical protein
MIYIRGSMMSLALALSVASARAQVAHIASAADSANYQAMVAQLSRGDTTVDFAALRRLAVQITPEQITGTTVSEHFAKARETQDPLVGRAHVDSVLMLYAGHVRAHRNAEALFVQRGDSTRARAEAAIVRGFIRSIGSQSGLTPETAMSVISIDEEYAYFNALGVRRTIQALVHCGDGECDALTGTEARTGMSVTYYFRLI